MDKNPEMKQQFNFKASWKNAWQNRDFKFQSLISLSVLSVIAIFINDFFQYIEMREGFEISDILLNNISPINLSLYIFIMLYAVIIASIFHLSHYPGILLKCLQAYVILTSMRILTILFFPLEPSASMIQLEDPFIGHLFYGNEVITKDLFFSGHISTMLLLVLYNPFRPFQYLFLTMTILTAICILFQHVHYSIDILAAPLFSYLSYKAANSIPLKINT